MDKNNANKKTGRGCLPALLIAVAAAAVLLGALLPEREPPVESTRPPVTAPRETMPLTEKQEHVELGNGLVIEMMDRYAGIYMEDGSNEVVQDVMMLMVCNTSEQDLQLARIRVHYPEYTAEFELTNLPTGARAVVLEKGRRSVGSESWLNIETENVVFFSEPMDLMPDRLELGGKAGLVEVTNISGGDLEGPVYVYYKNSAEDLFYGGITYRVTVSQGLKAGETVRIPAGHYDPENCSFVMAACAG